MEDQRQILNRSLMKFQLSEEFYHMCILNDFKTLGEIVQLKVKEMLSRPEFNLRMLTELYQLLEDNHLEKCLKEQ